ncbi:hypothetical protein [Saccharothrix sp. NRRL B-16348]|uniref:hypothetical protein n=1 Tax=Saccharothrix sp. NRRL B-16348 TaxID=1415542 RepID=UPI0006AE8826|nr:hypothetical protein [Saccharothrix sp. NRRL B-16348]
MDLRKTGAAEATAGGIANTGYIGEINLSTGAPVRTRYLRQVARIAPPALVGRDAELAELARFCTGPEHAGRYAWWRAGAWAGKSALMSWFALHPPPGVRVVSFFVTARLAGQDHRGAFIENVLEQLATLLGTPLPPLLTESTSESHLLGMLDEAAEACEQRGERLVLLVDGLDEDRGVTVEPDDYSIAGLLPHVPRAGMRVVVSGRLNPPVPGDVPDSHPLRDPAIVRHLAVSPSATALRSEMQRELRKLLRGPQLPLVGLLTAAGGGLTARDLAELTGGNVRAIADDLGTVAGRSFALRNSTWRSAETYLLGHEELHAMATDYLGDALADHRERLHEWAEDYRDRGWPESTPEYLLRGYFRVLDATGDFHRMVACATDSNRADRMLEVSGADQAALAEITAVEDALLSRPEPDITTMARLAVHRERLTERNTTIPITLPAAWARLGEASRAEALAGSISDPGRQAQALALVAEALAETGRLEHASDVVARVEGLVHLVQEPTHRATANAYLVRALVPLGRLDGAAALFRQARQSNALVTAAERLVPALVHASGVEWTRQFVDSLDDKNRKVHALLALARVSGDGDPVRAVVTLMSTGHPVANQVVTVSRLAATIADLPRHEADRLVESLDPRLVSPAAIATGRALIAASAGDPQAAMEIVRGRNFETCVALLGALPWEPDHADVLLGRIPLPDGVARATGALAAAVARAGELDRAVRLALEAGTPDALIDVATSVVGSDPALAAELVSAAQDRVRLRPAPLATVGTWCALMRAAFNSGDTAVIRDMRARADRVIAEIPDGHVFPDVVELVAWTGRTAQAERLAEALADLADRLDARNLIEEVFGTTALATRDGSEEEWIEDALRGVDDDQRREVLTTAEEGGAARLNLLMHDDHRQVQVPVILADAGATALAEELAWHVPQVDDRARVWSALALHTTLGPTGRPTAYLMKLRPWRQALTAIAAHHPTALTAIAAEIDRIRTRWHGLATKAG